MKNKRNCLITVIILFVFGGCTTMELNPKSNMAKNEGVTTKIENEKINSVVLDRDIKAAMVLSTGGLGDRSSNDTAFRGLKMAKERLIIDIKHVEPVLHDMDEEFLKEFARDGYDIIFATGYKMKEACQNAALEFPNTKFAIIDEKIDMPNVSSITFKEEEGAFLVGAVAAMTTKKNIIGFVGGENVDKVKKIKAAYQKGAIYVNSSIKIVEKYIQSDTPYSDIAKGRESALAIFTAGADIVFHSAGGSGIGVINAAKETGNMAIGTDEDQDDIAPGVVITSMVKNVDVAVYETIKSLMMRKFTAGENIFGIREGGIGITEMVFTRDKIPEEAMRKIAEIKDDIINGKIKIE